MQPSQISSNGKEIKEKKVGTLRPHNPLLRPLTPPIKIEDKHQKEREDIKLNEIQQISSDQNDDLSFLDPQKLYDNHPQLYLKLANLMKQISITEGHYTEQIARQQKEPTICLLYTSPSPRDRQKSRMPSSA
eukprot:TRINITY_DN11651_c0_g1_i2.p3 TRINITY_DN11651_c0_g1~~TRINITY_DN11651_c0_g1_i2.p3  ORF type:complete len:132 (-),score=23.52 TRINITY_DN11651_c0_g1_i2:34-429(-)